jgi:hypothetical protein
VPSSEYLISTSLITSNTPSITFDNLSQHIGVYRHLRLQMSLRTVESAGASSFVMRFNSDSGSNYSWHHLRGNGSVVNTGQTASTVWMYPGAINGGTSAANAFSIKTIDILDSFSSNKNKTMRALGGDPASSEVGIYSGAWFSTSPIDSIFMLASADFAPGTRVSLYGVTG